MIFLSYEEFGRIRREGKSKMESYFTIIITFALDVFSKTQWRRCRGFEILRCEARIRARGKNAIVRDAKPASRRRRILSCVSVASRRHYSPSLAEGRRRDFNYADESASFLRSLASLNGAARDTHVPEMPLLVVYGKKQAGGNEDEQIAAFIGPCLSTVLNRLFYSVRWIELKDDRAECLGFIIIIIIILFPLMQINFTIENWNGKA